MRIYPLVLLAFAASALLAEKKPVTIDALTERPAGRGGGVGGTPVWAPDGKRFAFTQGAKIALYDVPSKSQKDLVSLEPMDAAAVAPPEPAVFGWQNRRVSEEAFQWSSSGTALLIAPKADLFLYHIHPGKSDPLTPPP